MNYRIMSYAITPKAEIPTDFGEVSEEEMRAKLDALEKEGYTIMDEDNGIKGAYFNSDDLKMQIKFLPVDD